MDKELLKQKLVPVNMQTESELSNCIEEIETLFDHIFWILVMALGLQMFESSGSFGKDTIQIFYIFMYSVSAVLILTYLLAAKLMGEKYDLGLLGMMVFFLGIPNAVFIWPIFRLAFMIFGAVLIIFKMVKENSHLKRIKDENNSDRIRKWEKWNMLYFIAAYTFLVTLFLDIKLNYNLLTLSVPTPNAILLVSVGLVAILGTIKKEKWKIE